MQKRFVWGSVSAKLEDWQIAILRLSQNNKISNPSYSKDFKLKHISQYHTGKISPSIFIENLKSIWRSIKTGSFQVIGVVDLNLPVQITVDYQLYGLSLPLQNLSGRVHRWYFQSCIWWAWLPTKICQSQTKYDFEKKFLLKIHWKILSETTCLFPLIPFRILLNDYIHQQAELS